MIEVYNMWQTIRQSSFLTKCTEVNMYRLLENCVSRIQGNVLGLG